MSHASAETSKKPSSREAATHRKDSEKSAEPAKRMANGMDREEMIAVAAYYLAEHRGFDGGDPLADWLAAEADIDAAFNNAKQSVVH
ncbi:MAG: DUF2934 domain-containing protein [Gallionellaceae bacterium]